MNEITRLQQLAGIVSEGEGDIEKVSVGHVDNKKDMLSKELYHIGKNSVEIHKLIKDLPDSDFPHWWQAKVIKAKEYIEAAKNYLEAELNVPEEQVAVSPEIVDNQDPSGVS